MSHRRGIRVPFIGLPIFLDHALGMYKYSRAVLKVPVKQMQPKDLEYMEDAMKVLETRPKRYFILGTAFSIAALFIPQFFNTLPIIVAAYARLGLLLVEKLPFFLGFALIPVFIGLTTLLIFKHKWVIWKMKCLKEYIMQKLRRDET